MPHKSYSHKKLLLHSASFLLFLSLLWSYPATAHFRAASWQSLGHVFHSKDGLIVYLRLPASLVLADAVDVKGLTDASSAQFVVPEGRPEDRLFVWNFEELDRNAQTLEAIVSQTLTLEFGSQGLDAGVQQGTVEALRIHPLLTEPSFHSLAAARQAMKGALYTDELRKSPFIGESYIDVKFHFSDLRANPDQKQRLHLFLVADIEDDEELPEAEKNASADLEVLLVDYYPGKPVLMIRKGSKQRYFNLNGQEGEAAFAFIKQGALHILTGVDHLLYVICLTFVALRLRILAIGITGFTIGHSASLALGFFGIRPSGAWFLSCVEIGIALSILYIAILLGRLKTLDKQSDTLLSPTSVLATTAIGLLHGYGFSSFLSLRLDPTGIFVTSGLLSFNLGVELGQLLVIGLVWPLVLLLRRSEDVWRWGRQILAVFAAFIAVYWIWERTLVLAEITRLS